MTKTELEAIKQPDEVVCDFVYTPNGTNDLGYTVYKIDFTNPPANFQLVHIDQDSKLAVLKDLDYVPPAA